MQQKNVLDDSLVSCELGYAYFLSNKLDEEPLLPFFLSVSILILAIFHAMINASDKIMLAATSLKDHKVNTVGFF